MSNHSFLFTSYEIRQGLKAPAIQSGKKIVDIFAAHRVLDPILLFTFRPAFNDPTGLASEVRTIPKVSDDYVFRLGGELVAGQFSSIGLQGQPVMRMLTRTGKTSHGICGNWTSRYNLAMKTWCGRSLLLWLGHPA